MVSVQKTIKRPLIQDSLSELAPENIQSYTHRLSLWHHSMSLVNFHHLLWSVASYLFVCHL